MEDGRNRLIILSVKWLLIIALISAVLFLFCHLLDWIPKSYGMEIEPQVKYSFLQMQEHGVKYNSNAVGMNLSFSGGREFYWQVMPGIWSTLNDSNQPQTPDQIVDLTALIGYRLNFGKLEVIPLTGIYAGKIERGGNPAYQTVWSTQSMGNQNWANWTYIDFIDFPVGVNLNYKVKKSTKVYSNLHLLWPGPFHTDANIPRLNSYAIHEPHVDVEAGIKYQDFTVGAFYKKISFDQLESNVYLTGVIVGYKF